MQKELTGNLEIIAKEWTKRITDWDIHAGLPAGLELSSERIVEKRLAGSFSSHGTNFDNVIPMFFSMAIPDVEKKYSNSNLIAVFPYGEEQEIVWYSFTSYKDATESDIRTGYSPATMRLLFSKGDGTKFINEVRKNPELIDKLISVKFPNLVATVKIKSWKNLLYLPNDLIFNKIDSQVEVLSSKELT